MLFYLKGKITHCFTNAIVLDVNNIGYFIYTSHPEKLILNNDYVVYIYEHQREEDRYLVGFIDLDEFSLFKELIKSKGIGPKSVLLALKNATPKELITAIKSSDIDFLANIPGIGEKHVYQLILDLKGKGMFATKKIGMSHPAAKALREMGYKVKDIKPVISQIEDEGQKVEEIIKTSLKLLKNV